MTINEDNTLFFIQNDGSIYFLLVSPPVVVEKILQLAFLRPGEILYDLGSGDGRIIIRAAHKYGARAIGIESNKDLFEYSRKRINELDLQEFVKVIYRNFYECSINGADVVVFYLDPEDINQKMECKLRQESKYGSRIITINSIIPEWTPTKIEKVSDGCNVYTIYVYRKHNL